MTTTISDISQFRTSAEKWLGEHESRLGKGLPYDQVVSAPHYLQLPSKEHPILQHSHVAALCSMFPAHFMPTTVNLRIDKPEFYDRGTFCKVIEREDRFHVFDLLVFDYDYKPSVTEAVLHLQFAFVFTRCLAEIALTNLLDTNPSLGFNFSNGFFSANNDAVKVDQHPEVIVNAEELIRQFGSLAETNAPVSFMAARFRSKHTAGIGKYAERAFIKEAAETLAVRKTNIAFRYMHEKPAQDPFGQSPGFRSWCDKLLGATFFAPSKHD